jgi:hypothetical protein
VIRTSLQDESVAGDPINEYRVLFQRIGLYGVSQLSASLTALITLPIITKNLGVEAYGIYVLIAVTVALVPLVITLGLPYTMIRFFAASKSRRCLPRKCERPSSACKQLCGRFVHVGTKSAV